MALALVLFATLVALIIGRMILAVVKFHRVERAFDGEPSLPVLGHVMHFLGANEHNIFDRLLQVWGGRRHVTRISLLGHLILIVSDPDDIEKVIRGKDTQDKSRVFYQFIEYLSKNGLVTLNGNEWRAHRKALTPAFHSELLERYQEFFDEEAKGFLARIKVGVSHDVMSNLKTNSTRAFFRTALCNTIDAQADEFLPYLYRTLDMFPRTIVCRSFQPWFWFDAVFNRTELGRDVHSLLKTMDVFSSKILASSRAMKTDCDADFIKQKPTLTDILVSNKTIPDQHIKDEIVIFTGAAIETTVAALGWTIKTLSLRPDIQERILQEVREVVGDAEAVTPEHVSRLEYTERVIKESLRLTPAVPITGRSNLHAPTTFDGKHVPKGTTFIINMLGAHRDPRHWEEPLKFDPDRWLPERSEGRHHYAYMPFSAGPRNCIGSRYAMAYMKTLLATVIPKYRVDPVDDGHTDPATFPMALDIASRMPGGVHVVFTPRQPSAA